MLFENYLSYLSRLNAIVGPNYFQWFNGSFATRVLNPHDIDIVNFVPFKAVDLHEKELSELKFPRSYETFGMDAYIVRIYEPDHRFHALYAGDKAWWREKFEQTRITKNGKRVKKGFLELQF